jgi:hypothetical protein
LNQQIGECCRSVNEGGRDVVPQGATLNALWPKARSWTKSDNRVRLHAFFPTPVVANIAGRLGFATIKALVLKGAAIHG